MIAELLALIFAAYALVSSVLGALRGQAALIASGRRAVLVTTAFLLTAAASLAASFLTHDFGVRYVQRHSSRAMPWYYTLAAFYCGSEGSLLYWTLMLAVFSSLAGVLRRRAPATPIPCLGGVLFGPRGFFLCVVQFFFSPFLRRRR